MHISKELNITERDSLDVMLENSDNEEIHSDSCEDKSDSDLDDKKNTGNSAWADAMCRVLNTNVSKDKFILSKAKKDADIKVKDKGKDTEDIEIVDESGNILKEKKQIEGSETKSYKERRLEIQEKRKQKIAWENMCRVKPDITNKDKERELVRIATRGVVHLFNTVEKHQKRAKDPKEKKKRENVNAVKGTFMDILKSHTKRQISEDDPVMKKVKQEETWSILKDDFMMGAEMKDWDKDSDND